MKRIRTERHAKPVSPRWRPAMECLEPRVLLAATPGQWTQVRMDLSTSPAFHTMFLLPNGRVLLQEVWGGKHPYWYELTPNNGSYDQGVWHSPEIYTQDPADLTPATPAVGRDAYSSDIMPSDQLVVLGGEYTNEESPLQMTQDESATGAIYDPAANTWTPINNDLAPPFNPNNRNQSGYGDGPSEVLSSHTILFGEPFNGQTYVFDTTAPPGTDPFSFGPSLQVYSGLQKNYNAECSWVKLADGSIVTYDIGTQLQANVNIGQRFYPASNQWQFTGTLPQPLSAGISVPYGMEIGPGVLLPDGRAFFIGATGHTGLYTPSTNAWSMGPDLPMDNSGRQFANMDGPAAVLPNGHVLLTAAYVPDSWPPNAQAGPTHLFEFDPTDNTYTEVPTPSGFATYPPPNWRMLPLPTGQVLITSGMGSQLYLYTPSGSPQAAWRPTISSIAASGSSFTLTGAQINGMSEGSYYGDDAQAATNYPIVKLIDKSGQVGFATTSNWSSTGVQTGTASETVDFATAGPGPYLLSVSASGISSETLDGNGNITNDILFLQMGAGADNLTLRLSPTDATQAQVLQNGVLIGTFSVSAFNRVIAVGSAATDALTIDASNGNPIPSGGISYDGGSGAANSLRVIGSGTSDNVAASGSSTFTFNGTTIAYTNVQSVEFDGGAGNDTLSINSAQPVLFNGATGSDTLTINYPVTANPVFVGTSNETINIGTSLAFSPTFTPGTGSDTLNVNAGTYVFGSDGANGIGALTVNDNASVYFDATQHLSALNVGSGAKAVLVVNPVTNGNALNVITLSIATTGTLDLTNNSLYVNYGTGADPVATIRAYLISGYNAGAWNGYGIDTSSSASGISALGYADGADGIVPNLATGSVLVKFTRYGDLNLDGAVNFTDFARFAQNYGKSGGMVWDLGDLNYDGAVTGADLTLLNRNYDTSFSGDSNTVTVTGTAGNDVVTISLDSANPSLLDVVLNGVLSQQTASSVSGIIVNALDGNDSITIDSTYGNPIPPNGISIDGGTGTNTLIVKGGGNDAAAVAASSFTLNGKLITYENLQGMEFDGGPGSDTLTIAASLPFSPVFRGGTINDTLNVNAGTYTPAGDAGSGTSSAGGSPLLTINDSAALVLDASQNLATLNIAAAASAMLVPSPTPNTKFLNVGALSISSTGRLDSTNNSIKINYGSNPSPFATIRGYIIAGFSAGAWNGYGIQSSIAGNSFGLGYADGADNVVPGLSAGTILIKFTRYGDLNLDGTVNLTDLLILNRHFGLAGANWDQGDLNYDGSVGLADFTTLSRNFGLGV